MDQPIVKIEKLSHRYSVQWAISDVSFEIDNNGIYGLLGSNGAGKSTLMNILCGVLKQTRGDVIINGVNTKDDPIAAKEQIGFLPQKPPLYNDLTVEEYLKYTAVLRNIPHEKISAAIDHVLEQCNITHFRRRLIRNLSGGYQQRVGIAQSIIHKPTLVVLDEPTNGLDPNQILDVRRLIKEIGQERTVILSTHILTEVQATCDHLWMIEQGQMVFSGTVSEFDNYATPNSLIVTLLDPPARDVLAAVAGVSEVEELSPNDFRIKFSDAGDVVERIVVTSVENHWRLTGIGVEKNSLDSIFAELSMKNNM